MKHSVRKTLLINGLLIFSLLFAAKLHAQTGTDCTPNQLDFGTIVIGQYSASQSTEINVGNPMSPAFMNTTITAPDGFQISFDDANWQTTLGYKPETDNPKTLYVRFAPTASGFKDGLIRISKSTSDLLYSWVAEDGDDGWGNNYVYLTGTGSESAPTLSTTALTDITYEGVSTGGYNVSSSSSVSEKGVVWGTSTAPILPTTDKTSDGSGTGSYTSIVTGLSSATHYYIRAYATNGAGTGYGDEYDFWTLDTEPVSQPAGLSSPNQATDNIDLSWTNTTADGYLILYKEGSTPPGTDGVEDGVQPADFSLPVGTYYYDDTDGTPANITGLSSGTTYSFAILAYNKGADNTTYNYKTNGTISTTTETVAMDAPANQADNLSFSNIDETTVTVSWSRPASNGGDYCVVVAKQGSAPAAPTDAIEYSADPAFGHAGVGSYETATGSHVVYKGTGSTVNITSLTGGQDYYFQVFEYNNTGVNAKYNTSTAVSNPNSVTTVPGAPNTQATDLIFSNVAETSFDINWTNGSGEHRVVIIHSSSSITPPVDGTDPAGDNSWNNSGQQVVFNGANGPVTITNLDANTTYYVKVFECNNTGASTKYKTEDASNNPSSQITLKEAPTLQASNVSFTNIQPDGATVNWSSGNGAGRIVKINTVNSFSTPSNGTDPAANSTYGGSGEQVVYNGTGNNVAVDGLSANTQYYFRVYEYNNSGTGTRYNVTSDTDNPNSVTTSNAAPSTQTHHFGYSNKNTTTMTVSWLVGDGENRVVKINTSNSFTNPTDGTDPSANAVYGGSGEQVVYKGNSNSVAVSNLSAETQYWFRAYEYNNSGTSTKYLTSTATDNPLSFYTLSLEPDGQSPTFSVTETAADGFEFSFVAASSIANADGYLILMKQGSSAPTGLPNDAQAYVVDNVIGDAVVKAVVSNSSSTTATISGLTSNTEYSFVLVPYNFDGSNSQTYNYNTTSNPTATGTTSASSTTWTGTGNWNTPANWSSGLPGTNTAITVASGTLTVDANQSVGNMTINAGAAMTINSGVTLTVNGDVTLKSDASTTATGSLMLKGSISPSGTIKVERYMEAGKYYIMGVPLSGLQGEDIWPHVSDQRVREYDEVNDQWVYFEGASGRTKAFESMKGYSIKFDNNTIGYFEESSATASFHSGNYSQTSLTYTDAVGYGWHMVANPYACAVDWDGTGWTRTNLTGAMYVWDAGSQNYLSRNGGTGSAGRYIPALQGFFVQVQSGTTGSIQVTPDAMTHSSQTFYKTQQKIDNLLVLTTTGESTFYDETYIRLADNATINYDYQYDADKLFSSNEEVPQLYTVSGNDSLSINALPTSEQTFDVPLHFKTQQAGEFNLSVKQMTDAEKYDITLEDTKTTEMTELSLGSTYTFTADPADDHARFVLHYYKKQLVGVEQNNQTINWRVYPNPAQDQVNVQVDSNESAHYQLKIYNSQGQVVKAGQYAAKSPTSIDLSQQPAGVYIIEIICGQNIQQQKLILTK